MLPNLPYFGHNDKHVPMLPELPYFGSIGAISGNWYIIPKNDEFYIDLISFGVCMLQKSRKFAGGYERYRHEN